LLTAPEEEAGKIVSCKRADDFVTKPLSRVNSGARAGRCGGDPLDPTESVPVRRLGDLTVDAARRSRSCTGASVHLDREQRERPSRCGRRRSSGVNRPANFLADLSHEG
jgi:hypothetical protein